MVPADSHVALAHPDAQRRGRAMLRRGYNFVDGTDALGAWTPGCSSSRSSATRATHFIPVQNAMARHDALSEYLEHTGSALFAVPPGVRPGEHVGQALFAYGRGDPPGDPGRAPADDAGAERDGQVGRRKGHGAEQVLQQGDVDAGDGQQERARDRGGQERVLPS